MDHTFGFDSKHNSGPDQTGNDEPPRKRGVAMWTLVKRAFRRIRDSQIKASSERGSIAAVFAVLMASGVLVGLVALAFDAGVVYQEQQTLRIASSAAARGLASKCSIQAPQCANQAAATALVQQILDANSRDGKTAIDELCGVSPLNSCAPLTTRSQDCAAVAGGVNFVRVTAKTQTPTGTGIATTFSQLLGGRGQAKSTNQLWNCGQAKWQVNTTTSSQITYNILMPACDYPGSSSPFVSFEFIDQGNTPAIPRTTSCSLQVGGAGPVANLSNVMNGFAPFTASVGSCDVAITVALNTQVFDNGNDKKFCGGSVGSIGTWIQDKINNNTTVPVALGGTISSPASNQWNIYVIGFTGYKFLGYRISNSVQGGATPPGGWSSYPAGVPNNARCSASRPCFYGYYTAGPSFLTDPTTVQIVP
jgi:Flp pilus assembly protein TadG